MIYSYQRLGNWGRLGNQLFEIAGTLGEAIRDGAEVSFPSWEYQNYFSVPSNFFTNQIGDRDFSENYLQNLNHFLHIEDMIHEIFAPSELSKSFIYKKYTDILSVENTTALHVRRGDYLHLPMHHPTCSLDYFEKCIDYIGSTQLVVFSDDLNWCRQQSIFRDAYFADNDSNHDILNSSEIEFIPSVISDLFLMTKMNQHIISNSTFSWWGAFLAKSKKVLYPMPWYGPEINIDVESTMIPKNWIRIER